MKIRVIVLLVTVAALHLVLGGLFLAGGCTQEDPPMPPGIYVPPSKEASTPAQPKSVTPESVVAPVESVITPQESVLTPKGIQPEKATPEKKSAAETTYKVVKGDSLWSVSRKHSITIEELALYNNLPANAKLKIGQTLLIPPTGKVIKAPSAKAVKSHKAVKKASTKTKPHAKTTKKSVSKKSEAKESLPADGSYTIQAGDNFTFIAKRFGVKVSDLIAANPGISSSKLKIGQKIKLPGSAASADKTVTKPEAPDKTPATPAALPASNKTQDVDSLLEDIPNPDKAPAKSAESAPVASKEAINAVSGNTASAPSEADKLEDLPDGTGVAVTTGSETTLAKLAIKYKVKEADVKLLNPAIPADGKIKAGMVVKLP